MSEPVITVSNISKKFARSMKRAMCYGLSDIARTALIPQRFRSPILSARVQDMNKHRRNSDPQPGEMCECVSPLRNSEFWALRDVSFELNQGECLGVIGANGAGKSTLFSLLSGIYAPTHGRIQVCGRLQALIALGAGFHPMLSGRENVYINAAVLGMTGREIDRVLDQIIDFSEIGEFIDMPVKRYSSGMLVRLGFAVAVHMKPDVLLVDEVLAVGDLAFRNKSFNKMTELINTGIPVVFVSHSMRAVETICSRVMWLEHGEVHEEGKTHEVVANYIKAMESRVSCEGKQESVSLMPVRIEQVRLVNSSGVEANEFKWREPFTICLDYSCDKFVDSPYFHAEISRPGWDQKSVIRFHMMEDGFKRGFEQGSGCVMCTTDRIPLAPGEYEIRCGVARAPTALIGQKHYQEPFVGTYFSVSATPEDMARPGLLRSISVTMPPIITDHTWNVVER